MFLILFINKHSTLVVVSSFFPQQSNSQIQSCGDFNTDLLNPQKHKTIDDFINTMCNLSLFPKILRPTRVTFNCATLIDNINQIKFSALLYTQPAYTNAQCIWIKRPRIKVLQFEKDYILLIFGCVSWWAVHSALQPPSMKGNNSLCATLLHGDIAALAPQYVVPGSQLQAPSEDILILSDN